jgi:two-component system, chemotaxis family, CheB/CheR fusion protein
VVEKTFPPALSPIADSVAQPAVQEGSSGHFPIVGIGASAGGLEAFELFFRHLSADSGMAFVLVSHLDPSHESILTEILQRSTAMPVIEAHDQLVVSPNAVYVIPPNREMAILNGALQLSVPERPRGQRMPIDTFLRSLADDQAENAVGIILSGTGTDGTLGLRAILGGGGISLVQKPDTARYDGMPSSAIQAGYASHVLPVEDMPAALLAGSRHHARHELGLRNQGAQMLSGMNQILLALRSATGHDFGQYKKSNIGRRIERRMAQHNIDDLLLYVRYIKEHPAELQILFKELLINVTSFFRDPDAFAFLKQEVLPQLLAGQPADYVFRVWVAACASGEEAYSIAILLREFMNETQREFKVQIFSTDLDEDAIATARAGVYPPNIAQDVSPERLHRFFVREEGAYRVKKEIREMVVFAIQNVIKDPPFTRLDLLSCRNLLIYFEPELQYRLLASFHYALKPGGALFLSPSESIGKHADLFAAQSTKWKLYRAKHAGIGTRAMMHPPAQRVADSGRAEDAAMAKTGEINFAELTRRALLRYYAPASVVIDLKGNILYVHGDTGEFLRPAPGQATLNVIEMARQGLSLELRQAIQAAVGQGVPTLNREIALKTDGNYHTVSFSLRQLPDRDAAEGLLLLSFHDAAPVSASARTQRRKRAVVPEEVSAETRRIEALERELSYTRENLQATIEEQQSSNEELKSTNEEMQSTNEELQSTNEELETSKEELQSVNEELVTVNAELQTKIELLGSMQNDMKNLLDNINIGAVFLDEGLSIRRFTREATRVYRLLEPDVGRPLADIKSNLEGDDLIARSQTVLDTLLPYEVELHSVVGAWYLVRIQPYRTLDNVIEGVVLTFTDISKRVQAEMAVEHERQLAAGIVDTVREPLLVLGAALRVVSASRSFYRAFQVSEQETVGRAIYDLGNGQWNIPALRELLDNVLRHDQLFEDYAVEHNFPVIGRRKMLLNARRIQAETAQEPMILLAIEEVA